MNNIDEKNDMCCQEDGYCGVESCDCQGICTCEAAIIYEQSPDDCDNCCCTDEDDDEEYDELENSEE